MATTPTRGFNVVQVNETPAGRQYKLIENFSTKEQAERVAVQLRAADSGRQYEVHGPKDRI